MGHAAAAMTLPSSDPPRWTFAVATVIWAMIVGFAARFAIAVFVPSVGGEKTMRWLVSSPLGLAVGAAVIQVALLATAFMRASLMPELRQRLERAIRLRPSRSTTAALFIVGLAPLANLCGILVAKLIGTNLDAIEFVGTLVRRANWFELGVLAVVLTALPAIVEESIFRGLVLGSLDELGAPLALIISAFAFGAFHLDVAQGVATTILGLGFGYIVQTTGSLLGAMVAHGTYNLFVLVTQRFLPITTAPAKWQLFELAVGLVVAGLAGHRLYRLRHAVCAASMKGAT
jgi:membrane protease YdiL (CAAX protease family)